MFLRYMFYIICFVYHISFANNYHTKLTVEPDGSRLNPRTTQQLIDMTFTEIDPTYQSVNPLSSSDPTTINDNNDDESPPYFFESEEYLMKRCRKTMDGILAHANGSNLCIVSHTPCAQAMALYLEGAPTLEESQLGPWPLGGVTLFTRELDGDNDNDGKWKLEMYADTEHMPGEYKKGLKPWSLPCLSKSED